MKLNLREIEEKEKLDIIIELKKASSATINCCKRSQKKN